MQAVIDRIVQYPNRYQLTNVETQEVLGTFDFDEVTGTVQQVGTEIDAELFQTIADDLAARVKLSGGELKDTVVTFSDISGTAANVASGDTSATLWGKVKNWFSRLKALAFKDKISNTDVAENAAIAQSKVNGLESALAGKQPTITGAATSITNNNLTARRVVVSDESGKIDVSAVTATELNYISGADRNIQNQIEDIKDGTTPPVQAMRAQQDGDGANIVQTYAKKNGSYPNMTVGNATNATNAANAENANNAASANKVANALTVVVDGESTVYDGSAARTVGINTTSSTDPEAVHFTEQALTSEQQTQARENIGAAGTSGNYPNMTVGNATHADSADSAAKAVTTLNNTIDLNTMQGAAYWGKRYYGGGSGVANRPDGVNGYALEIIQGDATSTVQILYSVVGSESSENRPTHYQRSYSAGNSTWSEWEELVTAEGNYPNLAAGEAKGLSKVGAVYADSASRVGWHKFAEVPLSALTAVSGASSYSAIVLVNGLNPYQGGDTANSGIVEVDMRVDGSRFTSSTPPQIKLLSGNVDIQKLCFKRTDTEVGLYINTSSIYVRYSFTVLDERYYLGRSVDAMEFADEYYGAAAPDGAVYATNVNQAAYAQEAAMLDEAYKAGNNSSTSQNGYVKLIDFTAGNNWAEKTLRLEFGDDNASNVPQNPCGMEIRVQWNSSDGVSPRAVLLYGDKQIADKLYVSYNPSFTEGEENTVSVYYKVSGGYDMVAYKPLYMTPRQGTNVTGVNFYQPTQSDLIAELPSGNTNTAITALENFRDLRYAKYDADGNDISDTYAKQSNISNPNLIINPDFKINQRNKRNTDIGSQSYGADRWKQLNSNGVVFTSDDFLQITGDTPATNLSQPFEEIPPAGDYTLSVMSGSSKTNLSVKSMNFTITDNGELQTKSIISLGVGMYLLSVYITDGVFDVRFTCLGNSGTCYVKWVKLEPGTVATKFVPPDPATELLKCQRYYIAFNENAPFNGWIFSATSVRITIPVPTAMRESPTLVFPNGGSIGSTRIYSNGGTLTPSAYSVQQAENNQIVLSLTVSGATANQTAAWRSISKAALDAEI